MMQRFVSLGMIPEIRSEPSSPDLDIPEVEVVLTPDTYWELQTLIQELRYARAAGVSGVKQWSRFRRILAGCIIHERDRLWFKGAG